MRVWESLQGSKITAEILSKTDTHVVLKTDKGKELNIAIDSLSQADKDFLKGLNQKESSDADLEEKAGEATDEDSKTLPVLNEGVGKGLHAYYEGNNFIAKVNSGGSLDIYIKEEKKVVENWKIAIIADAYTEENGKREKYYREKIIKHSPAAMNPKEVKFTLLRRGDVTTEVIYEFSPEGFTTWFRSVEGEETPADMTHRLRHLVGSVYKVNPDEKFLKKMKLKRKTVDGKRLRNDFFEVVDLGGDTEQFEFTGPLFGKKKITIQRGKSERIILSPYNYRGVGMRNGFAIYLTKTDITSTVHAEEKVTFTIK